MSRIAIDIDSTLHHYWDLLDTISRRRFGIALPYAEQSGWAIPQLPREHLHECIVETHSEENILSAEPYPGAVETVREWHAAGHWIHITSHRSNEAHGATARWLDHIGLPWDDLHCSYDKVARCVELGIDVLVDDSPVNLEGAAAHGILGATLIHPWNAAVVDGRRVLGAADWDGLRERLTPALGAPA